MKNTDIEKQLEEFFAPFLDEKNENRVVSRSMLIDGPWGCGKTYQIMDFLKNHQEEFENKKRMIGYISLFGLDSIEAINNEICNALFSHSRKMMNRIKRSVNVFGKTLNACSYFNSGLKPVAELVECISNQLGGDSKTIKNQSVIIIDDLERLSTDKVSYSDLLGYLNGLMAGNCRIICIMNSKAIINSIQIEQNGFKDFYEKVFDEIRIIDDVTKETYEAIFRNNDNNKDYDISSNLYPLFKSNLRIAQRAYLNYKKVLKHIEDKDKYVSYEEKMTKEDLFKLCYYSTYMAFKYLFDEKKDEIDVSKSNEEEKTNHALLDDPTSSLYISKDWIFYALGKLSKEKGIAFQNPNLNLNYQYCVRVFTSFFFENNPAGIDAIFKKVAPEASSILNKNIFYLSEKNKEKYCAAFVEMINKGDFTFDNSFFSNIIDILDYYSSFTFDEQTTNKIIEKMVEEKVDKSVVNDCVLMSEEGHGERCKQFMNGLQERYLQKSDEAVRTEIRICINKEDYQSATDLLEDYFKNQGNEKSKLIDEIIDHDFYFPDLSDDITTYSWDYCHKIVEIMAKCGKREFFNSFADKQIKEHSDDPTLVDRFTYLRNKRC